MDWEERCMVAAIGLMFLLIIFAGYMAVKDAMEWEAYAKEHCTVIGKMSGSWGSGVGTDGKVVSTYTAGKTGYKCDDGLEYWR
jgi:hypothetical protein